MNNQKTIRYDYRDENAHILFTKIRIQKEDGTKDFYLEREDDDGKIVQNITGCRKVLYRLPQLLYGISHQLTVFLVEGEKDVETLLSNALIATTTHATGTWSDEYTALLKDANVVILYDHDPAGITRRDMLCDDLYGNVRRLRVVGLPGLEYREKNGLDITDWLGMGNTINQFLDIVEKTPDYKPMTQPELQQKTGILNLISIDELFALNLPPREMLLAPFLPTQGLVLIVAKRGVGKTHIGLGVAYAVATGGTFLRWWAPAVKKVLYIDGEMPATLMQERLQKIVAMSDKKHDEGFFKLLTPDLQDQVMPNLSHKEGRDAIEPFIEGCDLVVIDNISCLFRSGSENDAESWQEAQEWALDLRRRGKSVLFIHHAGKSGAQRGTSKKEDALDAVILLKQPDDYQAEQGARFEIKFDKSRHFSGDEARSFSVQLIEIEGKWRWEQSDDPEEALLDQIATMKASGYTIQLMCEKTQRTKSQVETLLAKAKAKGLLNPTL